VSDQTYYKSRIRSKGQITVPAEVRDLLHANEGDDLAFQINEKGQVVITRLQTISPEQSWFWTERWQKIERQAQADLDAGRVVAFDNVEDAIQYLHTAAEDERDDAEDHA
jgi:AbrB family looped-hinge helix DNA binding protein